MNKALRLGLCLLLTALSGYITLYIPPDENILLILALVSILTTASFLLVSVIVKMPYPILISVFIFLFLTINYLVGFQVINTLLLISGIIGLLFLVKK